MRFSPVFNKACSLATIRNIPSSKVEDLMLLQALSLGIRDNKTRERLLTAEYNLSFDSVSRIVRNHETVVRGLTQLQIGSTSSSYVVPINAIKPTYPITGRRRFCNRCGNNGIIMPNRLQKTLRISGGCMATGTIPWSSSKSFSRLSSSLTCSIICHTVSH